ncbi:MAG: SDR family oxidoreductase [Oleiphilaceae bacterium]|nr:SDR family oxidoreductase [Oleiphilaceae bacterium]
MSIEAFSLKGKAALVTGASSGIGEGLALGLASAGATVVVAARRKERLDALVARIEESGGKAFAIAMDVTDRRSVDEALATAEAAVGGISIVVNNAGVAAPNNFLKISEKDRDHVMNTNFNGVWNVAQACALRMVANELSGSIINIASVLAIGAQSGQSVYAASKAAVAHLTRNMALDLIRHNIRVNAIAPGWFLTEMNQDFFATEQGQAYIKTMPARRLGKIEELVGPVVMLASDSASFVNGAVIPVDGAISVGA